MKNSRLTLPIQRHTYRVQFPSVKGCWTKKQVRGLEGRGEDCWGGGRGEENLSHFTLQWRLTFKKRVYHISSIVSIKTNYLTYFQIHTFSAVVTVQMSSWFSSSLLVLCFSSWSFNRSGRINPLLQIPQTWGFSLTCVSLWLFRFCACKNVLVHSSQLKDFTPLW